MDCRQERKWQARQQTARKGGSRSCRGEALGSQVWVERPGGPTPQEPAVDTALQAHQSLRKDFTSAGDSSGPLNPFSLPLQRFPQGHVCTLLAQVPAGHEDTRGEAPRVVQETRRQRADLAGGLALSLSWGPGGESSSPPPKLQRAKARDCLQAAGKRKPLPALRSCLSPSPGPCPSAWPFLVWQHLEDTNENTLRPTLIFLQNRTRPPSQGLST